MHRAAHRTTTRRRVLGRVVPSVVGIGLAVLLAGCGAGQITQTDTQQSGVNGANASAGPIALRDVQLAAPGNAQNAYQAGSDVVLVATIVNTGLTADTLLKVTTPAANAVLVNSSPTGTVALPGNFAVASGQDSDDATGSVSLPSVTAAPAAPATANPTTSPATTNPASSASATPPSQAALPPGTASLVLSGTRSINGGPLRPGMTIPMTFYFAHAGQVTIQNVPVGAPPDSPSSNG